MKHLFPEMTRYYSFEVRNYTIGVKWSSNLSVDFIFRSKCNANIGP
ncbi:MAG: hypothetical protein Q8909_12570 [Bacteroidota bacterium]|nr:hypothetical protein [Bacteroidota bacterium]